ncbi:MAG: hypothetical protein ISS25_03510 [Nanoarchaeota archaeon]|nr:hypothetical protein [DPANN group archaeon]MBL7116869.1 hypothetical protein [Nanoarchaeota archaeon]
MKESEAPRELAIEESKHSFYEDLKAGKIFPELKGYEMAYLFIIAMAYGVYFKSWEPIKNAKRSISRSFIEKDFEWLIKAVAITSSKERVNIIPDKAEIYKIAEEYANGGIGIIEKILKKSKPGEFETTMEKELSKIQKEK